MANRISRAVAATVCMALSLAAAEAAEKISWEDLQGKYGGHRTCPPGANCDGVVAYRSVNIMTRDGRKHHTRRLVIAADHMRLYGLDHKMIRLPRQAVARVEIRQRGRYSHHIADNAGVAEMVAAGGFGGPVDGLTSLLALTVSTPFWAYTVASAPVFLAADCVAFFRPALVFEIAP